MTSSTLALLGSGETSSQGRKVHDYLMSRVGEVPVRVTLVETPAAFQPNAHIVYRKIGEFMEKSLQNYSPQIEYIETQPQTSILHSASDPNYIFSGPGSPTYAARNLQGTRTLDLMVDAYSRGATLVLSSAAAIAAGRSVLRVYEIFKAGADLGWDNGLHLLPRLGLDIDPVIVTHWNNTEGGADLDTTHCYMGRERFERLVEMLPPATPILGIDEHTACIFEQGEGDSVRVMGAGSATIVNGNKTSTIPAGETFPLALLQPR